MSVLEVAVGVLIRDAAVLITRRRDDDRFAGYWEFPGGKLEAGETLEQCVVRELWEEVQLRVVPLEALPVVEHAYPSGTVRLRPFLCRDADPSRPQANLLGVAEARWVRPADLAAFRFLPANGSLLDAVVAACAARAGNG
jgi:mutator protein MutT